MRKPDSDFVKVTDSRVALRLMEKAGLREGVTVEVIDELDEKRTVRIGKITRIEKDFRFGVGDKISEALNVRRFVNMAIKAGIIPDPTKEQ